MPHVNPKIDRNIRAVLDDIARIESLTVADATQLLTRLREQVVLAIAEGGTLDVLTADNIKSRVSMLSYQFDRVLSDMMTENQRRIFVRGIKLVDDALAGANIQTMIPHLSNTVLSEVQRYSASLVTALSVDARARIASTIDLAVLGQKSATEAIMDIGLNLEGASVFGTIRRRAEIILRTEVNRMQAAATAARIAQHAKTIPDLKKMWVHSHVGIPRLNHLAMDGIVVGATEAFSLVSYSTGLRYEIDGPYDPILPAGEVINCRCKAVPIVGRYQDLG